MGGEILTRSVCDSGQKKSDDERSRPPLPQ